MTAVIVRIEVKPPTIKGWDVAETLGSFLRRNTILHDVNALEAEVMYTTIEDLIRVQLRKPRTYVMLCFKQLPGGDHAESFLDTGGHIGNTVRCVVGQAAAMELTLNNSWLRGTEHTLVAIPGCLKLDGFVIWGRDA